MTTNSSSLSDHKIGKPIPCQADIRPIYPARFSLTKQALDKIAKTGEVPPMPTGINDPNYELRRLRQGYFYLYSQQHVGKTTDLKGRWLVFKYTVSDRDSNAPELREELGGLPYQFTQYEWTEGNPRKEWVPVKGKNTYYHAFVNPQTAVIEFAYSEFRWPAELFEKLETDVQARATLMQKLPLKTLESDFSFILTEETLQRRVPDFNPNNATSGLNQNAEYRATLVGYNPNQNLMLPITPCENGEPIVVGVFDPLGNIYDVVACNIVATINDTNKHAEELYPVVTAKAVKSFEKFLRAKSYSGFPVGNANKKDRLFSGMMRVFQDETHDGAINNETWQQMEQYLKYRPTQYENDMINLTKAHRAMAEQDGNHTLLSQLFLINRLMVGYTHQPDKLYSLTNYMMDLITAIQSGISTRAKGIGEQAEMLKLVNTNLNAQTGLPDTLTLSPKSYGDYLANILTIADKSNTITKEGSVLIALNRVKFDVLLGEFSAGQLYLWQRTATNALMYHSYLKVFGLRLTRMQPTGVNEALEAIKEQMEDLANGQVRSRDFPKGMVQWRRERLLSAWLSIDVQDPPSANKWLNEQTRYAGIFLASMSALTNIEKWIAEDDKGNYSLAIAQVTADLSAVVAAFERKENNLVQQATESLFKKLNNAAKRYGLSFPTIGTQPGTRIWDKIIAFENIGRVASVMAVIIAYQDFKQGTGKGDKAQRDAAALLAAGEICTLLSTFSFVSGLLPALGIVGAALVILSVVVSFFKDNPYEAWVRTGFWGNSPFYWNRKIRPDLKKQLSDAKALSFDKNDNSFIKIKKHFDKEMEAYYNLAWGLTVSAKNNQWQVLEVHCPAFSEEKDYLSRLEVVITQYEHRYAGSADEAMASLQGIAFPITPKRTEHRGNVLIDLSTEKLFRGYRSIKVVETQGYPRPGVDIFVVKVKYPKLSEKTDTFWQKQRADYFEGEIILEGNY
ncbi:toxin VasX [Rodentibacter myodis]|uniref:Toxin VasX N-terminal region domain-containing protein n=1 Tax=Rodentibacter myodis TaxID=1907939 RepID=A0A1V3JQK2_9PAST|nr:toxin VasX [Rodentibacter myodis]OOF58944.1 hypothetical protein BKL49_05230 [Rodentibacter myodis]